MLNAAALNAIATPSEAMASRLTPGRFAMARTASRRSLNKSGTARLLLHVGFHERPVDFDIESDVLVRIWDRHAHFRNQGQ
jgi:hypothetical protein